MNVFNAIRYSARNHLLRYFPRLFSRLLRTSSYLRYRFPSIELRELEHNLSLAFPVKGRTKISKLARRVLVTNLVDSMAELRLFLLPKGVLRREIMRMRVVGYEHLEQALAKEEGVVLVSPPYGSFMEAGLRVAMEKVKKPVYYFSSPNERRPFPNTSDALFDRVNEHSVKIRNDRKGVITALRALRNGGVLCLMPDQITQEGETIHVPFFGRFFGVMKGAAFFSLKGNAQLLPFFCTTNTKGEQTLEYRPAIKVRSDQTLEEEGRLYQITAALFKETERQFRRAPAHWRNWMSYRSHAFISPSLPESRADLIAQLDDVRQRVSDHLGVSQVVDDWKKLLEDAEAGSSAERCDQQLVKR